MNLQEQLELLQGYEVKVGAASAFVFIGKCTKGIFNKITKLSEKEKNTLCTNEVKTIKYLENFNKIWAEKLRHRHKVWESHNNKKLLDGEISLDEYLKDFKEMTEAAFAAKREDLELNENRLKELKRRIPAFTPFLTREVKEVYDSELEPNTKIVVFEGEEMGAYWTKGEYERGTKYDM